MEKDPGPGKPGDSKILRAILILGGATVGVGSTLFADWGAGQVSGMGLAIAALFGGLVGHFFWVRSPRYRRFKQIKERRPW